MDIIRKIWDEYINNMIEAWRFFWVNRLFFIVVYSVMFIFLLYLWVKDRKSSNHALKTKLTSGEKDWELYKSTK